MDKVNESILSETILEDMKENRIDHMTYLEPARNGRRALPASGRL